VSVRERIRVSHSVDRAQKNSIDREGLLEDERFFFKVLGVFFINELY
jgi:hypothetical protein